MVGLIPSQHYPLDHNRTNGHCPRLAASGREDPSLASQRANLERMSGALGWRCGGAPIRLTPGRHRSSRVITGPNAHFELILTPYHITC